MSVLENSEELTPREKHFRKLNKEKQDLKKEKLNKKIVRTEVHIRHDSRGKLKYIKKIWTSAGHSSSAPIDKETYEALNKAIKL